MKFKVGDRVRCVDTDRCVGLVQDKIYTVAAIIEDEDIGTLVALVGVPGPNFVAGFWPRRFKRAYPPKSGRLMV